MTFKVGFDPHRKIFSREQMMKAVQVRVDKQREIVQNAPYDSLGRIQKRKRVFLEQDGKCNKCGNNEWLGKKIVLEFEHKDGNHLNNSRENVEYLCPNCHSQSPTWRKKKSSITPE